MTAQSKLPTLPVESLTQVREVRDSLNALLASAQAGAAQPQAGETQADTFWCKSMEFAEADALNALWRKLKTELRSMRGTTQWRVPKDPNEFTHIAMYLHTILVGLTLMLPDSPTVLRERTRRVLGKLKRAVQGALRGNKRGQDLGVQVDIWKRRRRERSGLDDNLRFVKTGPWEEVADYALLTARVATHMTLFLDTWSEKASSVARGILRDCDTVVSRLCLPGGPRVKSVLATCAAAPAFDPADLQPLLEAFQAKWKGATNLIDVDKLEHLRVATALCRTLAASVMAYVHTSPVTSRRLHGRLCQLMDVAGAGVALSSTTSARLVEIYKDTPQVVVGDVPKLSVYSRVGFLTGLLPVCVRIAVCFGTPADKGALADVLDSLTRNLMLSSSVVPVPKGMYANVEDALMAWWDNCGVYRWVNEKPMQVANPEHTATMLYILCSLHKHLGVDDPELAGQLRELRLEGCTVVYPATYNENTVRHIVNQCNSPLVLDKRHMYATVPAGDRCAVVRAVFSHALKCLKRVATVTDGGLVRALRDVGAYAATLPAPKKQ